MSWPEYETTTSCPYDDASDAKRNGYNACETCVIPSYSCPTSGDNTADEMYQAYLRGEI